MILLSISLRTVKVAHHKDTAELPTRVMPTPQKLLLPMLQHIGRPCTPSVKVGDVVLKGQVIGDSEEFMSAPIHAPTSGKVTAVRDVLTAGGSYAPAVEITADGEDRAIETAPIEVHDRQELIAATRRLGLVGLGGAGFPTSIKFAPKNPEALDTLIINATECEPFITSDYREMMENGEEIADGIEQMVQWMGLSRAIIGIENNKPAAVEKMRALARDRYEVKCLPSSYPQGAEKVIIYHCTGRRVLEGQLPADQGVLVLNVTSLGNLMRGLRTGMPLTHRRVTVSGDCVAEPANVLAPIGTSIRELIDFCGGKVGHPAKLLMGGPMMGISVYSDTLSIVKNNNAILLLSEKLGLSPEPSPCIRCGRCIQACPLSLMPTVFEHAWEQQDFSLLEQQKVQLCMECGCCAYVCPANRPLVQVNRLAKQALRARKK